MSSPFRPSSSPLCTSKYPAPTLAKQSMFSQPRKSDTIVNLLHEGKVWFSIISKTILLIVRTATTSFFFPLRYYTHTHTHIHTHTHAQRCTNPKSQRCSIFKSNWTPMTLVHIEVEHLQHPRKCPFSKGHPRNTPLKMWLLFCLALGKFCLLLNIMWMDSFSINGFFLPWFFSLQIKFVKYIHVVPCNSSLFLLQHNHPALQFCVKMSCVYPFCLSS